MAEQVKSKYRNAYEGYFHGLGYKILSDPYQEAYVKALLAPPVKSQAVFVDAAAGTGKTSIAIAAAYYLLKEQKISKIIYVRNTVALRENGFLPGTVEEKEEVFMKPLKENIDRLGNNLGVPDLFKMLITQEKIEAISTSYIRGIDIEGDVFVIIDEAQNLSLGELQGILTRKHDTVKAVIIGSHLQVDTPHITHYGSAKLLPFEVYMDHFCSQDAIPVDRIELHTNYRGSFASYADKIQDTLTGYRKENDSNGSIINLNLQ